MKNLSTRSMIEKLEGKRGAAMFGFIAVTNPYSGKPLQKNRVTGAPNQFLCDELPNGTALVKVQRGHAMMNCHYNRAVEKRVAGEINDYRASIGEPALDGDELKAAIDERFRKGDNWQQVVVRDDGTLTPFAEHKTTGERYLRTMFYKPVGDVQYVDIRDGKVYEYTDIADVLPTKSDNKNQGLSKENQVRYNVWKLEGIRGLKMDGEAYRVRPALEREAEVVFDLLNARLAEIDIPQPPTIEEATAE